MSSFTVVTACDEVFSPGAIALYNSITRNASDVDFYCLAFGSDEFCASLPMKVIANPGYPAGQRFPKGGRWSPGVMEDYPEGMNPKPEAMPAMYARLLIPELFSDRDRVLWVDADCLVIGSLGELEGFDFQGHCMASTDITEELNSNFRSLISEHGRGNALDFGAPGTGTMLINIPVWRERRITEQCFDLMNTVEDGEWLAVVQCAIILAVKGDFAEYGWEYMQNVKRDDPPKGTKIIHFPVVLPWDEFDMSRKPENIKHYVRKYWEPYR